MNKSAQLTESEKKELVDLEIRLLKTSKCVRQGWSLLKIRDFRLWKTPKSESEIDHMARNFLLISYEIIGSCDKAPFSITSQPIIGRTVLSICRESKKRNEKLP